MNKEISPTILYFGTPVALICSLNEDGSPLIMSFCRFFGLGGEVHPSALAQSGFMREIRAENAAR